MCSIHLMRDAVLSLAALVSVYRCICVCMGVLARVHTAALARRGVYATATLCVYVCACTCVHSNLVYVCMYLMCVLACVWRDCLVSCLSCNYLN